MTNLNEGNSSKEDHMNAQELYLYVSEILGTQVRALSIELSDDGIVINGNCDSYHSKQLVQEIIGKSTSRRIVSNLIVVRDSLK
jgi:hypothetical protein